MFSIMVILWCRAMVRSYKEAENLKMIFLWMAILWLLYGIGIEFVQEYFIPNRSFDAGDIAADAGGCVLGLFFSRVRYIKKK